MLSLSLDGAVFRTLRTSTPPFTGGALGSVWIAGGEQQTIPKRSQLMGWAYSHAGVRSVVTIDGIAVSPESSVGDFLYNYGPIVIEGGTVLAVSGAVGAVFYATLQEV